MDNFKEDPIKKVLELVQEMKRKFLDKIKEEYADNYFKEIPEKKWLDQIIEMYCSNFTQKVSRFLSFVKKFKLNNIIKKVKIGLAIRRRKKIDDFENFSFHLIPPEEFVKGKIIFETYIGQIIHPLNIPDN